MYTDDNKIILKYGKLLENCDGTEDDIFWNNALEHNMDGCDEAPTEISEKYIIEYGNLVWYEVISPIGDEYQHIGKLIERKRVHYGKLKIIRNDNTILDTK